MPTAKKKGKNNAFREVLASSGQARPKGQPAVVAAEPERRRSALREGYVQVGANIPEDVKLEVQRRLLSKDVPERNFSELVTRLLRDWLNGD